MHTNLHKEEEEVSLKEFIRGSINWWKSLITAKWMWIAVAGLIGSAFGVAIAWLQPKKYASRLSFVVEEGKASMGGLASLAGQFGFDIGGSAGGGVFSGDNILLFMKSESLCRETLLTPYDSGRVLADRYIEVTKLKKSWEDNKKIGKVSFFTYSNGKLPRIEDSLMQVMVERILEKDLVVNKPDKKASFIEVITVMPDELLSKQFNDRLVKIATDRYVESKVKVKALNVEKLQHRADSLEALLNSRTYSAASSQQNLVDLNPALRIAPVAAEISGREKTIAATIFGEVTKNLEIAKIALSQETPVVQMVDVSTLPLKVKKQSKLVSLLVGGFLGAFAYVLYLIFIKWWRS
ncbi:hypothetical protein [Flavihumibacter solisilvae]|uniref:Lipopolysaccharide biosynthesis protein n=1 Tax=Flavihumibacter solisilvae TaxID=1349421 RepID=A0A0C1L3N2_9BACT|nr:hypothetical protein [Flavihumibacter solisilvae]KIC94637.1 hypothetical protein OI18_11140 [Flavihumibacter solisilvae]